MKIKITLIVLIISLFSYEYSLGQYLRPTALNENSSVVFSEGSEYIVSKTKNSAVVVNATLDGKEISFFVLCQNKSDRPVTFDASKISAVAENGKQEKIDLKVYTYDEYVQKYIRQAKSAATWSGIATGIGQIDTKKTQAQKDEEMKTYQAQVDQYQRNAEEKAKLLLKGGTLTRMDENISGQVKVDYNKKYTKKITLYIPSDVDIHEVSYTLSDEKPSANPAGKPSLEENYYTNGLTKYNQKNYDDAILDFTKYIGMKPAETKGYLARASCRMMKEDYDAAIKDLDKLMEIDSANIDGLYTRAAVQEKRKDYVASIADYSRIIQLQPDSLGGYLGRGNIKLLTKDFDGAIADYTKLTELQPSNAELYFARADIKLKKGNTEGAVEDYGKVIQLMPEATIAYYKRALVNYKTHGLSLAKNDFSKILELEEKSGRKAWTPFALHYLGRDEEALAEMKKTTDRTGDYYNLACLYSLQNDQQNAIQTLGKQLEKGYRDFDKIIGDEDLDNVKYTPEFNDLLSKYGVKHKFNPQEYVQKYVEQKIIIWQQKGKYEKSDAYLARVNEKTRSEEIERLKKEAIVSFKTKYLAGIDWHNTAIEGYDADKESFKLKQDKVGSFVVNVPVAEAEQFEKNYKTFAYHKPDILLKDESVVLSYLEMNDSLNNKTYVFDIQKQTGYNPAEFVVNFDAVKADLPSLSIGQVNSEAVKYTSIGKSDVDVQIPENGIVNNQTFAVVIGNENYKNEIKVNFAANDATSFYQYAIKTLGVPKNQIHLVTDATFGQMLEELKWLNDIAKAYNGSAKLIFYYAGHGMPDEQSKSAFLIPTDGNSTLMQTAVKVDDLYARLTEYPTQSVTVFLDACFSGGSREGMLAKGRGVKIKPKEDALKGNLVVFSATSGDETAYPYKDKCHGLFTYYLLNKLKETKGNITYQGLYDYLKTNVNQQSIVTNQKPQTPKLNVSPEMSNWESMKLVE